MKHRFTVTRSESGRPLAEWLRARLKRVMPEVLRLVRQGQVRIDGQPCTDPARRLRPGQQIDALPEKMRAIIANAVDAASADMSMKAIDRYSKDYQELQTKDNVKFYKTPDAILKQQLEVYDEVVKKKSAENTLFKEILQSQLAFAKRTTQWEQDTVVSRKMAYDHYWGANGAAKKI